MMYRLLALGFLLLSAGCSIVQPPASVNDGEARANAFALGLDALEAGDYERGRRLVATVAAICPVDPVGRRATLVLAASELDPRSEDVRPGVAAELTAFQLTRPGTDAWVRRLAGDLHLMAQDYGAAPLPAGTAPAVSIFWSAYGLGTDGAAARRVGAAPVRGEEVQPAAGSDGRPTEPAAGDDGAQELVREPLGGPECRIPAPDRNVALPELPRPSLAQRLSQLQGAGRPVRVTADTEDVAALQAEVRRLQAALDEKEQELSRIRRTLRP